MKHTNFFAALKTAIIGVRTLWKESRNARIQIILFILVVLTGIFLRISLKDWPWILLSGTLVITLEAVNTSLEQLADLISLDYHPKIKLLKDIAAAAVLMASIFAFIMGIFIFTPYLRAFFPL